MVAQMGRNRGLCSGSRSLGGLSPSIPSLSAMNTPKTSVQLFRDAMRLVKHVAGVNSPKAVTLSSIIKQQFRANAAVSDQEELHRLKQGYAHTFPCPPFSPLHCSKCVCGRLSYALFFLGFCGCLCGFFWLSFCRRCRPECLNRCLS